MSYSDSNEFHKAGSTATESFTRDETSDGTFSLHETGSVAGDTFTLGDLVIDVTADASFDLHKASTGSTGSSTLDQSASYSFAFNVSDTAAA